MFGILRIPASKNITTKELKVEKYIPIPILFHSNSKQMVSRGVS